MHPVLFNIGPIPIRAYGLMLCVAVIVALLRTLKASDRTGIKRDYVIDVTIYSVLSGVIFAHVASILLNADYFKDHISELFGSWKAVFSSGGGVQGLSFHGGLIGGIGAAYLYTRAKKIPFLKMADLCAPGIAIGYGITRIGCYLNGCCYGTPTNLPWGVSFPLGHGEFTVHSHPTQIYSMLAGFVIFGILILIEKRSRFTGQVFFWFMGIYSAYRFLIEFLRKGVTAEVAFWGLTQAQIVSLAVILVAGYLLWNGYRSTVIEDAPKRRGKG